MYLKFFMIYLNKMSESIKMPSLPTDIAEQSQWSLLLGDAKKVMFRCAECTKPITSIGFCNTCSKVFKIKNTNLNNGVSNLSRI